MVCFHYRPVLLTKRGRAILGEYRPKVLGAATSLQKRLRGNRAT